MVKDPHLTTPSHEAFHAYFDMFTSRKRQDDVLREIKDKHKITDDIEAEEILAE
jgi:hypothetical protein